jgi:hypothetical protein
MTTGPPVSVVSDPEAVDFFEEFDCAWVTDPVTITNAAAIHTMRFDTGMSSSSLLFTEQAEGHPGHKSGAGPNPFEAV